MLKNPDFFDSSLPANFDGLFEWARLSAQVFGRYSNEDFMDIDAVMEKNGRFLHFETKSVFSPIPNGQWYTMHAYHRLGCVTYIIMQFDSEEKNLNYISRLAVWYPKDDKAKNLNLKNLNYVQRFELLVKIVKEWRKDAENKGSLTIKEIQKEVVEKIIEVPCQCWCCKIKTGFCNIFKRIFV